jgi:hypothetical protein
MNKLLGIAMMALVFASCQDSENAEKTDLETSSTTTTAASPAAPIADSTTQNIIATTPSTVAAPAATTVTTSPGAEGLNPAHGAPGHRCDIAVGAPLNSPPGNTTTPAGSSNPASTMSQTQTPAQPANGKQRLNPAHGEPGHDCSVAVGQPLKG